MKNNSVIVEYIKEAINENVLEDSEELSYNDHLIKLGRDHSPEIENILKDNIYSDNRYGGTSMYSFFNKEGEGYSMSELAEEGEGATNDILEYFPSIPYIEDGLDESISDMVRNQIERLLDNFIKLTRSKYRLSEGNIYKAIRNSAKYITDEWSLIYLKKKKMLTEYIDSEDPINQIINKLQLSGSEEKYQLDYLVKDYFNQYYDDVTSSPETSLQVLKDSLSYYIDVD